MPVSLERIFGRPIQFLTLLCIATLYGCIAQSDLKRSEKELQQQLAQTRAKQGEELSTLREHEIPHLRGELEKAMFLLKHLYTKQEGHQLTLSQLEKIQQGDKATIFQRLDSLELVIGKILLRLEAIEKRFKDKP